MTPRKLGAPLLLLALACGGTRGGDVIRPADPKAGDALGEAPVACEGPLGYGEPFVVDWSSTQRLDLEVAMKSGLVPVKYTCEEFRIVKGCKVRGDYAFAGVSRKEDLIRIDNAAEVRANFRVNVAKLEAEMARGSTIELALVLVGKQSSSASTIARDALEGSTCDDATHVVGGVAVGAFALATGSAGQASAVAEVFKLGGAGGSTSSSKQAMSRDGELEACASTSPADAQPPDQCRSAIRVELLPLAAAQDGGPAPPPPPAEALPPDPCQPGFVRKGGKCTRQTQDTGRQCEWNDAADCEAQCKRGNQASCYNFVYVLMNKDNPRAAALAADLCAADFAPGCDTHAFFQVFGVDTKGTPESIAAGMKEYDKNCLDRGYADSCAQAARLYLAEGEAGPGVKRDVAKAARFYERGCALGDGINSCVSGAKLHAEGKLVPKNFAAARRLWERGCTAGVGQACRALADRLGSGRDGFEKDPAAALKLYQEGCDHDWEVCEQLGDAYAAGLGLPAPDRAKAQETYKYACEWTVQAACKKVKK